MKNAAPGRGRRVGCGVISVLTDYLKGLMVVAGMVRKSLMVK